ncbi:MAG: siphovirus Gp157 family protein [Limnoraphis robusta]
MSTLHELTQELKSLLDILESMEDSEIPAELEDAITEILSQRTETEKQTHTKIDGYVSLIRGLEAEETAIDAEIERLQARKKSLTNKRDYLKNRLFQFLEIVGLSKIKTTFNTISIRQASQAPLIIKCDAQILPEQYRKVTITPDKIAIKDAIKRGDKDVVKFAEYGEKSTYLSIR